MNIGVDFGGVLTETTSPPEENYLAIPPRENCIKVITAWGDEGHMPILISQAAEELEPKAREWLSHWDVVKLFKGGIEFCRSQEGKIDICLANDIEVMIDDRIVQLQLLGGVVLHRILFNSVEAPNGMIASADWTTTAEIVKSLSRINF